MSSGEQGKFDLEANESLRKKDFRMRVKISRKESKESRYWLRLLDTRGDTELDHERETLVRECTELMNIFGAILRNSEWRLHGRFGPSDFGFVSVFEFRASNFQESGRVSFA